MPKAPSIFFNFDEWEKLEKRVKAEGYPSKYAYIKDLVLNDLNKDKDEDYLEYLCRRLDLGKNELLQLAWKEFIENHGLIPQ